MKIITRGAGSVIAKALGEIEGVEIVPVGVHERLPMDGGFYLFAQGQNLQKTIREHLTVECLITMRANAWLPMEEIEALIEKNPGARIVVMGSDSGFKWSHNGIYAAAKAALHRYVETKRMQHPGQQLVCVAPSMIFGSGMVTRRNEDGQRALQDRLAAHPMGRMVSADEIAHLIHYLLGPHGQFVSGVVIRMNGGEHCQA